MSFQMFHEICPEIAFRETRSITLPDNSSPEYVERIKRHYALFRGKIDG